jgi:hypothetical protein
MTENKKTISLKDLAISLAGPDQKFNFFHAQIFSFIPPSQEQVERFLREITLPADAAPNRHPASIFIGDFSTLIKHGGTHVLATNKGNLTAYYEFHDRKLPECQYLAIVSPAHKKDDSTNYSQAYETINFVRAFIAAFFGKLLFYERIAAFDFDLEGKIAFSTEYFRMPLYADFAKIIDSNLASNIVARLTQQQNDFRQKFQIACNFLSGAINQKDEAFRFSSYWIALEVLARGTSGAIRAQLAKAYANAPSSFINVDLRFDEIAGIRHNLLHKGQFTTLKSYQERLLQLYFWDIAIHQINLAPQRLTQSLVQSGIIEEELRATTLP